MSDPVTGFLRLIRALNRIEARFVLIGVAGINHYARAGSSIFTTEDRDLFIRSLKEIDVKTARSKACNSPEEARDAAHEIGPESRGV